MTINRKHFFNSTHPPKDLLGYHTSDLPYVNEGKIRLLASWEDFKMRRPHLARLLVELFGPVSAIEVHKEVNIISEVRAASAVGHLRPLEKKHRDLSDVSDS